MPLTVCGNVISDTLPEIGEHSWSPWISDNNGTTHSRNCECGETESHSHSFDGGNVVKQPTHLEEGSREYTCEVCGYVYTELIVKSSDHSFGEWQPEASVSGKHFRVCECGEREDADCTWDAGVITTEPSYEAEGIKTYTCTLCGATTMETIDKLEEDPEVVPPEDEEEDFKIVVPEGSTAVLEPGTVLSVVEVTESSPDTVKKNIEIVGGENATILASFDISLVLDGNEVQPGGKVAVTIPLPEGAEAFDGIQVVFIDDEGNVIPCETTVNEDGTVTFVTDHFSYYAVIGVPAASPAAPSNGSYIWLIVVAAVVIAVAAGGILVFKKSKGKA